MLTNLKFFFRMNRLLVSCMLILNVDIVCKQRMNTPSVLETKLRGHGGRVVTLSPPTSEVRVRFPARSQVGMLIVACCW